MSSISPPSSGGKMIGYARYNTFDGSQERQLEGISLDRISVTHVSVKALKGCQFFKNRIESLGEGDTLVVQSMDRLAGNIEHLRKLVRDLTSRGIKVRFVKEKLTFTGEDFPLATQLLSVMDAMTDFERNLRRERQLEGVARAKAKGLYKGRKKSLTPEQITELKERLEAGESKADLARSFNIGRVTLYRYAKTT